MLQFIAQYQHKRLISLVKSRPTNIKNRVDMQTVDIVLVSHTWYSWNHPWLRACRVIVDCFRENWQVAQLSQRDRATHELLRFLSHSLGDLGER